MAINGDVHMAKRSCPRGPAEDPRSPRERQPEGQIGASWGTRTVLLLGRHGGVCAEKGWWLMMAWSACPTGTYRPPGGHELLGAWHSGGGTIDRDATALCRPAVGVEGTG